MGSLPSDFFSITSEELKKDQQNKSELLEREMMLRTKVSYLKRTVYIYSPRICSNKKPRKKQIQNKYGDGFEGFI